MTTPVPSMEQIRELARDLEEFRREKHITFHGGYPLARYGRAIEALTHYAALRAALDVAKEETRPAAWIKGHVAHTESGIEYDEEVCAGRDPPPGDGWHPLYPEAALRHLIQIQEGA